jgi:lysophospholipase L1-like esterase
MKPVTLAIIGDSAASGVGDSNGFGINYGWGYYLAKSFENPLIFINVARPGAQSLEVLESQLPKVQVHNPDICAVIVGGNDLLRNGFDPEQLHKNLRQTVKSLTESNTLVLMILLHDPREIVPMPKLLANVLDRRVRSVNAVTTAVAREFGAVLLDTRKISGIYNLANWHIDRMHPSKIGHQRIAFEFRKLITEFGFQIEEVEIDAEILRSKKNSILWMLRNGTPWFLKRSVDLLPAALLLMIIEGARAFISRKSNQVGADLLSPAFVRYQDLEVMEISEAKIS